MLIGFLDCKTNSKDAYAVFSQLADKQANIQLQHLTCPNPFKVPAACRKLFAKGAETIVAVVTTESDNEHEMSFLRDKVADVEIAESKYVFLVIEDVNVTDDQLTANLSKAMAQALEYLPAEPPATGGGMNMFSSAAAGASEPKHDEEEVKDFLEDQNVHKLF